MADNLSTLAEVTALNRIRGGAQFETRSKRGNVKRTALSDALLRAVDGIQGDDDTALLSSDGTTDSNTTVYYINLSAGRITCGGNAKAFAAQVDVELLGPTAWGKSYALDGSAAALLTADGKTYYALIVCVSVAGVPEFHAVFGDEEDDASEVVPSDLELRNALVAAGITGDDASAAHVIAEILIQRAAGDVTYTHQDPAEVSGAGDELAAARMGQRNLYGEVYQS